MPRCAREKIDNGIYHICVRGNNRQDIFLDDKDREEYLMRVRHYEERYKMRIYAYCLMTNHVHLLIYDNNEDISKFMQGLSLSYAMYFNKRHNRTGHLFQDRFTSVLVRSNAQLIQTSKYIHLNPVRAGIEQLPGKYKWSSYSIYSMGVDSRGIVDTLFIESLIGERLDVSRELYIQYVNNNEVDDEIASVEETYDLDVKKMNGIKRLSFQQAYKLLGIKLRKKKEVLRKKYDEVRAITVYLLGLISRLNWSQIAEKMNVGVWTVYKDVRKISYKMVNNAMFCKEIDDIIVNL